MARTKRLNESDKPVIDFGIADDQHKLIIPQNTTANLAEITPKQVGSIAFDTTLGEVVVNNGSGFSPVAAGGGVTSISTGTGLTGGPITSTGTISVANTTVTAGSYTSANITVNAQGQVTAATNGASSGANQSLSNLTSPTAINQALIPGSLLLDLGTASSIWNNGFVNQLVDGTSHTAISVVNRQLMDNAGHVELYWSQNGVFIGISGDNTPLTLWSANTGSGVSMQAPDSATTNYEFNLPATAGLVGQVLTSQAGANNAMTWTSFLALTSAASISGGASQTLTVTGLLSTDTILSVSQQTAGSNSLPLLGWTTVANNAITVQWSANPGAGAVVVVAVKR